MLLIILGMSLLTACSSTSRSDVEATQFFIDALLTATYSIPVASVTPTIPVPTTTPLPPTPTATIVRTPPNLPPVYIAPYLNPLDTPHTYINDTCQYLKERWDPNNSAPGTVVMPIMFHSITDGEVTNIDQIHVTDFQMLMRDLLSQGFQAISTNQLAGFLEHNAKIPPRSMILIVDDRKQAEYFNTHFRDYYDDYGWMVVNSWISAVDTPAALWADNAQLEAEGWVDHQAHGVIHNIPIDNFSTDEFINGELLGSIAAFQEHYGKTPIAYTWPGGGFSKRAVELARQAGYQLGFTINPRGPYMYNWIPLADELDPARPSYIPEGAMGDPLLVLPRYWDTDARYHIDTVRLIGEEAALAAEANRQVELDYYDIVCKNITGEIPTLNP